MQGFIPIVVTYKANAFSARQAFHCVSLIIGWFPIVFGLFHHSFPLLYSSFLFAESSPFLSDYHSLATRPIQYQPLLQNGDSLHFSHNSFLLNARRQANCSNDSCVSYLPGLFIIAHLLTKVIFIIHFSYFYPQKKTRGFPLALLHPILPTKALLDNFVTLSIRQRPSRSLLPVSDSTSCTRILVSSG